MKISKFKKQLKLMGILYKTIEKNFNSKYKEFGSLEKLIDLVPVTSYALDRAFKWDLSPEGYDYWNQIYCIYFHLLERDRRIKRHACYTLGTLLGYEVPKGWRSTHCPYTISHKSTNRVTIGCTTFDLELLDSAFKAAIDQLGYELV